MPDDAERRRLLADIDTDLEAVEQALAGLDDGSYGSCEVCGAPIGDEVLSSAPAHRRCSAHGPA